MLSTRLTCLVCLVCTSFAAPAIPAPAATAAPVTTTTAPDFVIIIESREKQEGHAKGRASVSTDTSTEGQASNDVIINGKDFQLKKAGTGRTKTSAHSKATDNGSFQQNSLSLTKILSTGGPKVEQRAGSAGLGGTNGHATTVQKTETDAKFQGSLKVDSFNTKGQKVAEIEKTVDLRSGTQQEARSAGHGDFSFANAALTDAQRFVKAGQPPTTEKLDVSSQVEQHGDSRGGASQRGTGTSRGKGSTVIRSREPSAESRQEVVAKTRATGFSLSIGTGGYRNEASSKTAVEGIKNGLRVAVATEGSGDSRGRAAATQKADSHGAAQYTGTNTVERPSGGNIIRKESALARAKKGHGASSIGGGDFNTINEAELAVKVKSLNI